MNSEEVINLINEVTSVHNYMDEGKLFHAGFKLAFHQQHLVDILRKLEEKEKGIFER